MGLLSFIFGKRITVEDEFFGQMIFAGSKRAASDSYFECRRQFQPSGQKIEIGIEADISGPTVKQIAFFKEIEKRYTEISAAIMPLIEGQFRNRKEDFKIMDFKNEFQPVYLWMPRCENLPIIWEIAFESDHDKNHTFTVTMSDIEAKEVLIDG